MSMNTKIDLSKLCGRKVSEEEAARIREVASNLELRDDDALWQLLAAIEYQRVYYEKVPDKIAAVTTDILKGIGEAGNVTKFQQRLNNKFCEIPTEEPDIYNEADYDGMHPMGFRKTYSFPDESAAPCAQG